VTSAQNAWFSQILPRKCTHLLTLGLDALEIDKLLVATFVGLTRVTH
jgi:hypothetical protein